MVVSSSQTGHLGSEPTWSDCCNEKRQPRVRGCEAMRRWVVVRERRKEYKNDGTMWERTTDLVTGTNVW